MNYDIKTLDITTISKLCYVTNYYHLVRLYNGCSCYCYWSCWSCCWSCSLDLLSRFEWSWVFPSSVSVCLTVRCLQLVMVDRFLNSVFPKLEGHLIGCFSSHFWPTLPTCSLWVKNLIAWSYLVLFLRSCAPLQSESWRRPKFLLILLIHARF